MAIPTRTPRSPTETNRCSAGPHGSSLPRERPKTRLSSATRPRHQKAAVPLGSGLRPGRDPWPRDLEGLDRALAPGPGGPRPGPGAGPAGPGAPTGGSPRPAAATPELPPPPPPRPPAGSRPSPGPHLGAELVEVVHVAAHRLRHRLLGEVEQPHGGGGRGSARPARSRPRRRRPPQPEHWRPHFPHRRRTRLPGGRWERRGGPRGPAVPRLNLCGEHGRADLPGQPARRGVPFPGPTEPFPRTGRFGTGFRCPTQKRGGGTPESELRYRCICLCVFVPTDAFILPRSPSQRCVATCLVLCTSSLPWKGKPAVPGKCGKRRELRIPSVCRGSNFTCGVEVWLTVE